MDKKQAEDFIYKSYLKAQKFHSYNEKDSKKRRNDLTFEIIRKKSDTPCVVITGSKGKGSVANMISQILQTEYTIGLMTSPHIVDFCERFQVNGGKITEQEFIEQIITIKEEIETIENSIPEDVCISPMGIQAYMALNYFHQKETKFNVFECGKGAKYDDVNNIKHEYAVINTIFLEHTRELGESLEEIAYDKAHVITGEEKCIYIAEQNQVVLDILKKRAEQFKVPIKIYGKDFKADQITYTKEGMKFDIIIGEDIYPNIVIPLLGEYQAKNCALSMALCKDVLENIELYKIKNNLKNINWPGRMEILEQNPPVVLDACINKESCHNVLNILKEMKIEKATVIIGIPDDKDFSGVAECMKDVAEKIILTKSQNPHYRFSPWQQECLEKKGIYTTWTDSVKKAMKMVKKEKKPIVILGTTSVVAEVKNEYM